MAEIQLEATTRREGAAAIIDLVGNINGFAEAALIDAYLQASSNGAEALVLNFSAVEYINSTGIAMIVSLLAKARKDEIPVAAYGLSDHYVEIFEITRLAEFMRIVPDEQTALALEAS